MKLVQSNTIGITPIQETNCLGQADYTPQLSGHGTIALLPDDSNVHQPYYDAGVYANFKLGDTVYFNAVAGRYIQKLNMVIVDINEVLLIDKSEKIECKANNISFWDAVTCDYYNGICNPLCICKGGTFDPRKAEYKGDTVG